MAEGWSKASTRDSINGNTSGFQNTTTSGFIPSTSSGESSQQSSSQQSSVSDSSSFQGISNPEALASLLNYIKSAAGGGTESYKNQLALRQGQIGQVNSLAANYTTDAAFKDAALLIQQSLQKSMEAQMPAISKAISGAGTSASSMQGLLSQKLATESAQAAGALGAEQAKAYGNIGANLQSVLEALTRINTEGESNFLKALDLAKTATSKSHSESQGTSQSTGSSVQSSTGATPANSTMTTYGKFPVNNSVATANNPYNPIDNSDYYNPQFGPVSDDSNVNYWNWD